MPGQAGALNPPLGKKTKSRIALIPAGSTARPASVSLANNGTAVAVTTQGTEQDATMTLATSRTANIMAGQYLRFVDANGQQFLARVRTNFTSGTSLQLRISETIPANATAEFPPEFRIRQSANLSESVATNSFSSFDHANSAVSIGEGTAQIALDGGYSHYDPGLHTAKYAKDNGLLVFIERELESPDATVFSKGAIDWAVGIVTSIDSPAADGDSVGGNVQIDISGNINRIQPQT